MKEYSIMELKKMTDDMIIKSIGDFIRNERLERNLTQAQLADRAGVNRTTISDLELGRRSTLITLIQTLRSLDQLGTLKNFNFSKEVSPLKLAKLEMKERKRARGKKDENSNTTSW